MIIRMTRCNDDDDEKKSVYEINSMRKSRPLSICTFDSASVATRGRFSSMLFVYSKKFVYIRTGGGREREIQIII